MPGQRRGKERRGTLDDGDLAHFVQIQLLFIVY